MGNPLRSAALVLSLAAGSAWATPRAPSAPPRVSGRTTLPTTRLGVALPARATPTALPLREGTTRPEPSGLRALGRPLADSAPMRWDAPNTRMKPAPRADGATLDSGARQLSTAGYGSSASSFPSGLLLLVVTAWASRSITSVARAIAWAHVRHRAAAPETVQVTAER